MRAVLTIAWAAVILGPLSEDGAAAGASYLDELFTIRNGAVVAHDVARVLAALESYTAPIILQSHDE